MNIGRIKKSVTKKYKKMETLYGRKRAIDMGCSYALYKIFSASDHKTFKENDPYSEKEPDHHRDQTRLCR